MHSEGFGLSKHSTAQGMKKKTEKTVTTFIIVLSVCVLVFKHFFFSLSLRCSEETLRFLFMGKKMLKQYQKQLVATIILSPKFRWWMRFPPIRQIELNSKLIWILNQKYYRNWMKQIQLNCLEHFSNLSKFISFNV